MGSIHRRDREATLNRVLGRLFGPKVVPIDDARRQRFAIDALTFERLAEEVDEDITRGQALETAAALTNASGLERVRRAALDDYTRNMRTISEIGMSDSPDAAKLTRLLDKVWDAAMRLDPNA
jgi:hypothetical protein